MKKFKLNPVARKWVKALRSGKYKQTTGGLTDLDEEGKVIGHCCLGVLCDMAVAEGIVKKKIHKTYISYGGRNDLLPAKVQKWAGMKTDNGDLGVEVWEPIRSLVGANDDGKSFKFIARLIEQKAKELFIE